MTWEKAQGRNEDIVRAYSEIQDMEVVADCFGISEDQVRRILAEKSHD